MSRYTLLIILNIPLILAALLGILVDFKLRKLTRKKFIIHVLIWLVILAGLASVKPVYEFLFKNGLTQTEPLSLFDVIQITGIITVLYIANRDRMKLDTLERRVHDLHQELSIKLSDSSKD